MDNILLVEDSKTLAYAIESRINEHEHLQCHTCFDMASAFQLLKTGHDFDLAILDLHLPDAENGEIVDIVKRYDIPVIVQTGSMSPKIRTTIEKKSIVDYVIKEDMSSIEYTISLVHRILSNRTKRAIIVDPSPGYRSKIAKLLNRQLIKTYEASDGEEALGILKTIQNISLILTATDMEKMNGIKLIKHIRKTFNKDELSIIVFADSHKKHESATLLKRGANDTIDTLFNEEEFTTRVNNNLEMMDLLSDNRDKANKDYLTGICNRRHFFELGEKIYDNASRGNIQIAIAMLDIDHFKNVNDTYGHDTGDVAIKLVATLMYNHLRQADVVARFGGEEFCMLIAFKDLSDLDEIFNKLREKVKSQEIGHDKGSFNFTVSIGIETDLGNSLEEMIAGADLQLYHAKNAGRDQIKINS
jgi:diguanylate cyclase (GGDEF)-like protein